MPPSPLFNPSDPTLLFTNAGMNQFKEVLLGNEKPKHSCLVNSQPCIRVSGKHNDLEEVGVDTYHHTLFEMLGNWSFGDYWKKEAILMSWEWVTEHLRLDKNKLYATVYKTDKEAKAIWLNETNIKPEHVLEFDEKDNFWEMGATGPCGPCSELHYDQGEAACDKNNDPSQGSRVNGSSSRYIEIWNLVFIEYDRREDGSLVELKQKSIDTGAGLERLTAIMQQKPSNYDTDLFVPLLDKIATITKVAYTSGEAGIPHRVLADHSRAVAFAFADGIRASNDGRGYVIRRLIRRALRYANQLGYKKPIISQIIPTVTTRLGEAYPQLKEHEAQSIALAKAEENLFLKTLTQGLERFENLRSTLKTHTISGQDAFKLYDTYGFPIDLTQLLATDAKLKVDLAGFESHLAKQKEQSKQAHQKKMAKREESDPVFNAPEGFDATDKVFEGVYKTKAGGGESKLPQNDYERFLLAIHHTATHLLNAALRAQLGTHITQAGSLVSPNKLRFDFTHGEKMSDQMLQDIENDVNEEIQNNIAIRIQEMGLKDAKELGALATFGETYGDVVRVVSIGEHNIELCGGNHVRKTGLIERCKLIKQSSVAAGVRRIEAICSNSFVTQFLDEEKATLKEQIDLKIKKIKEHPNYSEGFVSLPKCTEPITVNSLTEQLSKLESLFKYLKKGSPKGHTSQERVSSLESSQGPIAYHLFEKHNPGALKQLADSLSNPSSKKAHKVAILGSKAGGFWVVKCQEGTTLTAKTIIATLCEISQARGGGKERFAQAGKASPDLMQAALDTALKHIKNSDG